MSPKAEIKKASPKAKAVRKASNKTGSKPPKKKRPALKAAKKAVAKKQGAGKKVSTRKKLVKKQVAQASKNLQDKKSSKTSSSVEGSSNLNIQIQNLVRLAKEQGYVTVDQISKIVSKTAPRADQVDHVVGILTGFEVKVFDQEELEQHKEAVEARHERESQKAIGGHD